MRQLYLLSILLILAATSYSQDFFVLKKKNKTLKRYTTGSVIVFATDMRGWTSGIVTRISNDSFYVHEFALRYGMSGIDTVHFGITGEALRNVTLMPRPTAMVYYKNDRPVLIHGHEKFVWVKNGLVFQALGGGYVALNTFNTIRDKEKLFSGSNTPKLIAGVAVFFAGWAMKKMYRQHLELGKKYRLQYIAISGSGARPF